MRIFSSTLMLCSTWLCEFRDKKLDERKGRTPENCSFGFCPNEGGGPAQIFIHFGTFALKKKWYNLAKLGGGGGSLGI